MGIPNIVLCRIDNRLVHGQVGVTWLAHSGANIILVVDDEVAKDTLQQQIMRITADSYHVKIRFFTVDHTAEVISRAAPEQKIFIVTKTPKEMLDLVNKGVPIKEVNVGNMHYQDGKKQIASRVYVDDNDLVQLKELKSKIDKLYFQDVPTKPLENIVL
ncbi:PTS N-acetylgalactosamine transporter subunit IIB [Clostridiales bacterium COT073_COT-073]|nr:PTS N-acetylgalactosamine transporter subunit IIB [Clostridiales bacterium COT073_COT-073]